MRDAASGTEAILRRATLPSPLPESTPYLVTASEIVQHHLCPRRYHLRYRIGAPALEYSRRDNLPVEDGSADMKDDELPAEQLGDRVHRVLAEEPGSAAIEQILGALPSHEREEARRQVETFRRSSLGREASAGGTMRELAFVMARHGAILRGQIDLILKGLDGGLKVVDYKTSRIAAAEVEAKAADYELQLQIYSLAVREIFGRSPDAAYLHFLAPDVMREVNISAAALEEAEKSIAAFFEAHRSGSFPQHPGEHCFSCGYQEAYCPGIIAGKGARPTR
jgi:CRISPR/Cas system-associated exonuclease Cas4 (RecB family)